MSLLLSPGTLVDGRYQILSLLGQGGLGSVYKAKQTGIDRVVALKILHTINQSAEENRERFRREGKALSSLAHKNIPQFYQFGFWLEKTPFIAMEYLDGRTLRQELNEPGAMGWDRALLLTMQICDAMSYAHGYGIVHRDLKPENIILVSGPDGTDCVKVCDFGLAKFSSSEADLAKPETLTETGLLIGSVNYMSPEQCKGGKADHRSDIYSLGCMLYEMLSGEPLFSADTPIGLIHKHVNEEPPTLTNLQLPYGMTHTLQNTLAKDPERRYQSMLDLRNDLALIAAGRGQEICSAKESSKQIFLSRFFKVASGFLICSLFLICVFCPWQKFMSELSSPQEVTQTISGNAISAGEMEPKLSGRRLNEEIKRLQKSAGRAWVAFKRIDPKERHDSPESDLLLKLQLQLANTQMRSTSLSDIKDARDTCTSEIAVAQSVANSGRVAAGYALRGQAESLVGDFSNANRDFESCKKIIL